MLFCKKVRLCGVAVKGATSQHSTRLGCHLFSVMLSPCSFIWSCIICCLHFHAVLVCLAPWRLDMSCVVLFSSMCVTVIQLNQTFLLDLTSASNMQDRLVHLLVEHVLCILSHADKQLVFRCFHTWCRYSRIGL